MRVNVLKCSLPKSVTSVAVENSDGSITVLLNQKGGSQWQNQSMQCAKMEDTQSK